MKRSFLIALLAILTLFSATSRSEAAPAWLDGGVFPETEVSGASDEGPSWGAWFMPGGVWMREAVNRNARSAERFFVDVNGDWFVFDESGEGVPASCDPPEWYPWQDTPGKRGLASKGKDENLEMDKNSSFSWGEWENHFGGMFRRISPPGPALMGATHLVDENGSCYVLVVYPGATPRILDKFSWFPGFPPGWGIKPGTTVLVNKAESAK